MGGAGYGELGAALASSIPLATMLLLGVSKLLEILFGESRRTGYPVVRDCRLAGIAARSDPAKLKALRRRPGEVRVYGIASKNLVAAYPDETVQEDLDKMVRHGIGRLPVVDRNDEARLVGIITKGDVVKAYEIAARRLEEEA